MRTARERENFLERSDGSHVAVIESVRKTDAHFDRGPRGALTD